MPGYLFNQLARIPFTARPCAGKTVSQLCRPEAASSNFRRGEILIYSASGGVDYVTHSITRPVAGAASASLADTLLIAGWALDDATGVTGTPINLLPFDRVEVLMRLYAAAGSDAEIQDVAIGDLAELFRYNLDASNLNVIPVASAAPNATAAVNKVEIVGKYDMDNASVNAALIGEQAVDDDYGLVWVHGRPSLSIGGQ